jgi:hypothetical protein
MILTLCCRLPKFMDSMTSAYGSKYLLNSPFQDAFVSDNFDINYHGLLLLVFFWKTLSSSIWMLLFE